MTEILLRMVVNKKDDSKRPAFVPFTTGSKIEVFGDVKYDISTVEVEYKDDFDQAKIDTLSIKDEKYDWAIPLKNSTETFRVVVEEKSS